MFKSLDEMRREVRQQAPPKQQLSSRLIPSCFAVGCCRACGWLEYSCINNFPKVVHINNWRRPLADSPAHSAFILALSFYLFNLIYFSFLSYELDISLLLMAGS